MLWESTWEIICREKKKKKRVAAGCLNYNEKSLSKVNSKGPITRCELKGWRLFNNYYFD